MRRWLPSALRIAGLAVLLLVAAAVVLHIVTAFPWSVSWDLWTVLSAVGTVGATLVALGLALRTWVQERDATARFVSAWVTDDYQPRADGSSYRREVHIHVANESNEPVFNAMVSVHVGREKTPLGPLAAPAPISVIPPRRELVFDISVPLLAHSDAWQPHATLTFTDANKRRWLRDINGEISDVSRRRARWSKAPPPGDQLQLGDLESGFNPMLIALLFLGRLRDGVSGIDDLRQLLAPEAPGWGSADWDDNLSPSGDK